MEHTTESVVIVTLVREQCNYLQVPTKRQSKCGAMRLDKFESSKKIETEI